MNLSGKSLRPRKLQVPSGFFDANLTEPVPVSRGVGMPSYIRHAAEDKSPAAVLRGLLEQMTSQRCTPQVAEMLLTTLSTHFADLEANHRDLVSAVMTRSYLEVVTTEDALVRLNLLQLVEARARRWRADTAAENFYANRRLNVNEQVKEPSKKVADSLPKEQPKVKSTSDQAQQHEQRLVVSDEVEVRLFSNCSVTLQESYSILQNHYRNKQAASGPNIVIRDRL